MCFEGAPVLGLALSEETLTNCAEAMRARSALRSQRAASAKTVRTNRTMITNRIFRTFAALRNDEAQSAWSLWIGGHMTAHRELCSLSADFGRSAERMHPHHCRFKC
jgi:hypothetical protein